MKRYFHISTIFCIFAAGFSFVSCKGRTVDNMVPNGDTVEVVISQPVDSVGTPDTISVSDAI